MLWLLLQVYENFEATHEYYFGSLAERPAATPSAEVPGAAAVPGAAPTAPPPTAAAPSAVPNAVAPGGPAAVATPAAPAVPAAAPSAAVPKPMPNTASVPNGVSTNLAEPATALAPNAAAAPPTAKPNAVVPAAGVPALARASVGVASAVGQATAAGNAAAASVVGGGGVGAAGAGTAGMPDEPPASTEYQPSTKSFKVVSDTPLMGAPSQPPALQRGTQSDGLAKLASSPLWTLPTNAVLSRRRFPSPFCIDLNWG
jgi:hypothetical protein